MGEHKRLTSVQKQAKLQKQELNSIGQMKAVKPLEKPHAEAGHRRQAEHRSAHDVKHDDKPHAAPHKHTVVKMKSKAFKPSKNIKTHASGKKPAARARIDAKNKSHAARKKD